MYVFYSENINKRFVVLSIFNYFLLIFINYFVLCIQYALAKEHIYMLKSKVT